MTMKTSMLAPISTYPAALTCRARPADRMRGSDASIDAPAPSNAIAIMVSRLRIQSMAIQLLAMRFEYASTKSAAALLPREKDFIASSCRMDSASILI